ncbi:MAG: substrate-binding domain-containing protein [Actinomycetota bacterium]|nr:substrate-binding domain-containing protein [Actinomycetota bacterium]
MKRTSIRVLAVVTLAAVAVALAASGTSARTAAPPKKKQLPMKTIGILGPVDAAEVIKLGTDATATAAKALGWKVINLDPGGDPAKTAADMNSLVNSHVDAIVLTIIEPATVQAGLQAAAKAHIPVISTMSQTHASKLEAGMYWPVPAQEMNLLVGQMKKDGVPSGAKIGMIQLPQFYNALIAQQLFQKSAQTAGWNVVATHDADLANLVPDVNKATGDMIRANPDLKAIWGCCDFAVAGAVPAIQQSGKPVTLYSLHGVPSSVQFVKSANAKIEIANAQISSFIAIDALAKHWTMGAPIPRATPREFKYQMTMIDKNTTTYPYPTSKILAQFKARWAKLYLPAHK